MKPVPFDYVAPGSIEAALAEFRQHGSEARPLAGGQSLVPMLALRLARPTILVDLNQIEGFGNIERRGDELVIGAMARQADLLCSPIVAAGANLITQALAEVGHPPTRARGTIGGSLCHADPAAELPAAMVALEAKLTIRGPQGERSIQANDFFKDMFETAVGLGDLLTEIRIPVRENSAAGFIEIAHRKGDFAILSAAAIFCLDDSGYCTHARIVLGGGAPVPLRCPESEAILLGRRLDQKAIDDAAAAVATEQIEFDSLNASRAYRQKIAPVLVARSLAAAFKQKGRDV